MFRLRNPYAAAAGSIFASALSLPAASPARAQSHWIGPSEGRIVWLEGVHPGIEGMGSASSFWRVGARLPLRNNLALVAELPFAHADLDGRGATNETGVGNPYLGVEQRMEGGCTRAEFGARLPLAGEDNEGMRAGFLGDFVEGAEAFTPQLLPIHFGLSHACPAGESGWSMRLRGAGSMWISPTGGDGLLMALYGAQAWYERRFVFGAGVSGRAHLSHVGEGFAEMTVHQVGVALGYDFGPARPLLELRVPLDEDFRETVPYAIGVGVVVRP